jgi:hypothetical protein
MHDSDGIMIKRVTQPQLEDILEEKAITVSWQQ